MLLKYVIVMHEGDKYFSSVKLGIYRAAMHSLCKPIYPNQLIWMKGEDKYWWNWKR